MLDKSVVILNLCCLHFQKSGTIIFGEVYLGKQLKGPSSVHKPCYYLIQSLEAPVKPVLDHILYIITYICIWYHMLGYDQLICAAYTFHIGTDEYRYFLFIRGAFIFFLDATAEIHPFSSLAICLYKISQCCMLRIV